MKCKYYQHLIVLQASNLIKDRQENELNLHLQNCKHCRDVKEEQYRLETSLEFLRNQEPKLSEPLDLANNVMNSIIEAEKGKTVNRFIMFIDHALFILDRKIIKYGLLVTSVMLAFVFINQQYILQNEIQGLRNHIEKSHYTKTKNILPINNQLNILTKQYELSDRDEKYLRKIIVDKNDFEELVEDYNSLLEENKKLKKLIDDKLSNPKKLVEQKLLKHKSQQDI